MTKQTCSSWCSSGTMWFWCTLSGVIPMYLTAHWFQWSYSWFTSRMENGLFAFKIWSGTACFSSYIIFTTPVCRFPSSSGQRSFWLTALLQERGGFKGITVIHQHHKSTKSCPWETCRKVPSLPQHTQLLLSVQKLRFPIMRQTWTLWLLTNSTSLKLWLLE